MQFNIEKDKYINYYTQILKYIDSEFKEGLRIIETAIDKMEEEFSIANL